MEALAAGCVVLQARFDKPLSSLNTVRTLLQLYMFFEFDMAFSMCWQSIGT